MLSKRNQKKLLLILITILFITGFFLLNFNFYLSNFMISNFSYKSDYLSNVNNLKEKVSDLEIKIKIQEALIAENKSLKKQLNLKNSNFKFLSAELTVVSPYTFASTGIINLGLNDQIKKGQLVIKPEGLVGKISVVNDEFSEVIFTFNPGFTLMVFVGENNVPGILKGNGVSSRIKYVTNDKKIKIGDKVFIGNNSKENYPNIEIGTISEIVDNRGFFDLRISDLADPRNSKYISVIRYD